MCPAYVHSESLFECIPKHRQNLLPVCSHCFSHFLNHMPINLPSNTCIFCCSFLKIRSIACIGFIWVVLILAQNFKGGLLPSVELRTGGYQEFTIKQHLIPAFPTPLSVCPSITCSRIGLLTQVGENIS